MPDRNGTTPPAAMNDETTRPVRIEILHIDDCPNSGDALYNARQAIERLRLEGCAVGGIEVSERSIRTAEEARAVAFSGSPTVLVDGVDVEPEAQPIERVACRVYRTPAGLAGAPSIEQIAGAIRSLLTPR